MDKIRNHKPVTLSALCFLGVVTTTACGAGDDDAPRQRPASELVVLAAGEAEKTGSLVHKWGKWVVWCGHNICDGTYRWRFPEAGTFHVMWNVGHKCAGSAPYRLSVNGETLAEGRIPQHGGCADCTPQNIVNNPGNRYNQMKDVDLGRIRFEPGDRVELWVQNDFACGIHSPGAYAYYDQLRAHRIADQSPAKAEGR